MPTPFAARLTRLQFVEGPSLEIPAPSVRLDVRFAPGGLPASAEELQARVLRSFPEFEPAPWPAIDGASIRGDQLHACRLLAWLLRALQLQVGVGMERCRAVPGVEENTVRLCWVSREPSVEGPAARHAVRLLNVASTGDAPQGGAVADFLKEARPLHSTTRLVAAAVRRRGAPCAPLHPTVDILACGQGARRRLFDATVTDATGRIGNRIASDKALANMVLARAGLPTPRQALPATLEAALQAARELGFPVVVKPRYADRKLGATARIADPEALAIAFASARRYGEVVLEAHIRGEDHRLLVVGGRMVAAVLFRKPHVIGDGRRTVQALVEAVNVERAEAVRLERLPQPLVLDDETPRLLALQGLALDATPAAGVTVQLRSTANLGAGAVPQDVTAQVHPANRLLAERAAAAVSLDVAGVDFLTSDIGLPYGEAGGAICEINPHPALRGHAADPEGPDAAAAVAEWLVPDDGRIPTVCVLGGRDDLIARGAAEALSSQGYKVGMATRAGAEIGGAVIRGGDMSSPQGARMLLNDPLVEACVLEVSVPATVAAGLGLDLCDVALVADAGDRDNPEERAVRVLLLGLARKRRVLDFDDPHVRGLAAEPAPAPVLWVSSRPDDPELLARLQTGDGVAILYGDRAGTVRVLEQGREAFAALLAGPDPRSTLFGLAAAYAAGASPDALRPTPPPP